MKKVFNYVAVVVAALSLSLASCSTEDPATPLNIDLSKTATIKGVVLINSDNVKDADEQKWSAPDNVKFIVTLPYSDLHDGASGTYTVDPSNVKFDKNSGEYTITVPAGSGETTVHITICDFAGSVKKSGENDDKSFDVVWKGRTAPTTVKRGETKYAPEFKKSVAVSSDYEKVTVAGNKVN